MHDRPAARPTLAICYDSTSASPMELLGRLRGVCEILWVVDLADPSVGAMGRLLPRTGTVVDATQRTTADLVGELRDHGANGVISFTDHQLRLAATLASELGTPANGIDTVELLNDKFAQRRALAAAGLPSPRFAVSDTVGADGFADFAFPVVIKPLRGDSSRDVVPIADHDALTAALGAAADVMLVEEYLADDPATTAGLGSYVSVEMMVAADRPVPLALTGKFPLAEPFRETGNFMPHALRSTQAKEIVELATSAAVALGVSSGALHVEIKLTPAGPRIIEVNGRIGGGAIDVLHERRFGYTMTEIAARVALGEPVALEPDDVDRCDGPFLYEYFLQPPTTAKGLGRIRGLDGIAGTAGVETVAPNRSPGDALDWRAGSQGYVLRAGGVARDLAELVNVPPAVSAAADVEWL